MVTWFGRQNSNGDTAGLGVQARRFAPDGSAIGDGFLVDESMAASRACPASPRTPTASSGLSPHSIAPRVADLIAPVWRI